MPERNKPNPSCLTLPQQSRTCFNQKRRACHTFQVTNGTVHNGDRLAVPAATFNATPSHLIPQLAKPASHYIPVTRSA